MDSSLLTAALLETTSDGVLAFDRACRYTLWNPVMERISGLSAANVLGQHAFTLFPFLVESGEDRHFHEALAGRSTSSHERPFTVQQSGREGFFEARYRPLHDAEGKVIGGLGLIRDVTSEHHARVRGEAVRLHQRVLENMNEGVSVYDEDGTIVYTNAAQDRMFGYASGELTGKHISILNAHPEDSRALASDVIATLKRTGLWAGEFINRRKDGFVFVTRAHITAFESDGRPLWVSVQEDITRERANIEAIRQSNEQLNVALAAAHLGTWQWNAATDEITFDTEAANIFGLTADVPMPWDALAARVAPEDRQLRLAARATALRDRTPIDIEYRVNHPVRGQSWVAVKGRPLFDERNQLRSLSGVVQDISQQKRSEQALLDEARVIETINRIGQAFIGELDEQRLLQALTDAATELSDAQFGSFFYNVVN
ncbi:MAG TPA: PAS domain S-box protein, partial [Polyangia bacterium]